MAMKWPLILCIFLPGGSVALAQKQGNIWYFGDHAGLDFNSGSPVFITDGQTYPTGCTACHGEGTAVMSDSSGTLLLYSNGVEIWNAAHEVMLDGDGLMGSVSSTQAALILPLPGSSRFFYVFTTDDFQNDLQNGLRYTVVDMCRDAGLGGVNVEQKNILLADSAAEKMTAVKHANGTDYWVITHQFWSDAFHAFHLSAAGIVGSVVSHVGSVHPVTMENVAGAIGQLKASPNGEKLCAVNANSNVNIAEYFDFDAAAGVVSNAVDIQWNTVYNFYGVSFSPDNSKLYLAGILNSNGIYQFDLLAGGGEPDSVRASRTLVTPGVQYNFQALQLATDGKIYVTHTPMLYNPYLSVISEPNSAGLGCNYLDDAIDLQGQAASYGLPNFMDSYDYGNTVNNCHIGLAESGGAPILRLAPNPFSHEATLTTDALKGFSLTIHDPCGRQVRRMENLAGGSVTLVRGDLAAGVYVLRLLKSLEVVTSTAFIIVD